MDGAYDNIVNDDFTGRDSSFSFQLKALLYQLQSPDSDTNVITNEYEKLKKKLLSSVKTIEPDEIKELLSFIEISEGNIPSKIFPVFEPLLLKLTNPLILIESLLSSRDEQLVFKSFDLLQDLVSAGSIKIGSEIFNFFVNKYEIENSVLNSNEALEKIAAIVRYIPLRSHDIYEDPVMEIYIDDKNKKRRELAAKLLDLRGSTVPPEIIEKILGVDSSKILSQYLIFTRAAYTDLLFLIPEPGKPPPILESFQQCERICGKNLVQEAVSKLGWKSVNHGISVKHFLGLSFNGSLPWFLTEKEAVFFEKSVKAKRVSEFYLFTTCGGLPFDGEEPAEENKPVAAFRSYNLAHANLLQDILDVAPLTLQKVNQIIKQLDIIVNDFIKLFKSYTEECTILPQVYSQIKNKIITGLEKNPSQFHLSADITRLVQMFEDPQTIGQVHTLHGLKRYLHQRGLQLGFKLVDQSGSPNRSVNLVLASKTKILSVIKKINYADFEPSTEQDLSLTKIPYSIKVVSDGFKRQLLHDQDSFPSVNIFCYGNEIHYFVWFRNHPLFIRIDYSPPLQGGMIDLQYYGVSNYEIADHPNINLDAIRYFLQLLEFDVEMDVTRIHARYDKEQALDLSQLCEKAEYLFSLVPYMMDLDWVIGSLDLPADAKNKVIKAWAELFFNWGVLPVNKLISKDRLGIIQDVLNTPEGERELIWAGENSYQDRYSIQIPDGFLKNIFSSVNSLGIKIPRFTLNNFNQAGQVYLEKRLLNFLRNALSDGEIHETHQGFEKAPENLFKKIHEAVYFASIINKGRNELESAVALAKVIMPLEQTLKFKTTGTLENFKVQSALLPLKGETIRLFVLRDDKEIIRLAFFIKGNSLYQKRKHTGELWKTNADLSPNELMTILRYNNYTVSGTEPSDELIKEEIQKFINELGSLQKPVLPTRFPGEKIVTGLRASPGRAAGRILLGTAGRIPEDFDGHIFTASSVSPDENTILFHSAGIVATGGGILSHAGLIATQFNKPALIIPGKWKLEPGSSPVLIYQTSEYQVEHKKEKGYNIIIHYDVQEQEYQMQDGDLVVLDANEGTLQVFGQERDTIALFENLKSLGKTNEAISKIDNVEELLILRGKKLHVRHQVEKLLKRIDNPVLIKYAVREILTGNFLDGSKSTPEERAYLLDLIRQNDKVGYHIEKYLLQIAEEVENKFIRACQEAKKNIPLAQYPFEVVIPRLEVFRMYEIVKSVFDSLDKTLQQDVKTNLCDIDDINKIAINQLVQIRCSLLEKIQNISNDYKKKEFIRHFSRQLKRIEMLLDIPAGEMIMIDEIQKHFEKQDNNRLKEATGKLIVRPGDGTLELSSLIGWKAANLAELEMLGGEGLVPPWFVITDNAFQKVLDTKIKENILVSGDNLVGGISLREAINKIISNKDITNREKSLYIKNLWNMISLPEEMKQEVIEVYRELEKEFHINPVAKGKESKFYIAVRSSSCEEDAEIAARAGEFETYLFINGENLLIEYLKQTWSGLWTERAIHNRSALRNSDIFIRGGVIVQRIVHSRVSGVLQTINVAKGKLNEIVINAGLGMGEGVVSGSAAADQVIVSKEGNLEKDPLHFNYITADKKEQVLFNKKAGYGTILTSTLYHQRFRPALEYVELCELVAVAARLESAYGYPLDIEFGIEGTKLWILQVRPVATFLPALRETLNNYPLVKKITTQEK
jgi:hypothetical protein